jgi:hypothetical protein
VAEHVRWRAPYIRSPEWAKPGEIRYLERWSPEDLPESSAIICRNNAPLFRMALRLIRAGRRPQIIGNDITAGLVKTMKKFGALSMLAEDALAALTEWEEKNLKKYNGAGIISDKASCMRLFLQEESSLGLAIARAEQITKMTGPIQLMSGHKSKGLEFDHVFFLDQHLINRDRGGQQEDNLRYVICTRSKDTLTYVDSEAWEGE